MSWKGESRRHSLARRGVRTVIDDRMRLPVNRYVARGKPHEFAGELPFWTEEEIREFENEFGEIQSVEVRGEGEYYIVTDEGEYRVFEDHDTAWETAEEELIDMWQSDPGTFPVDWVVEDNIFISDTDRRAIASDESSNLAYDLENLEDEEILERAGIDCDDLIDEIDDIEVEIEKYEDRLADVWSEEGNGSLENYLSTKQDELILKKNELENQMKELVEEAKESLISEEYDRWYEGSADPVDFFVDELGIYTKEELLKAPFIQIDYEGMAETVLNSDGVGHIMASYDGGENEIGGAYIYRVN